MLILEPSLGASLVRGLMLSPCSKIALDTFLSNSCLSFEMSVGDLCNGDAYFTLYDALIYRFIVNGACCLAL